MRAPLLMALVMTLLTAVGAGPAAADGPPDREAPGWFLPLGLNLGGSLGGGQGGFVLGGELSAVHLFGTSWAGLYGDVAHDFGADSLRAGAGVEAGWFIFGAELGWVVESGPGDGLDHGLRLGGVIGAGLLTGYVRWSHLFRGADRGRADIVEVGALLKWPIPL